jgi:arylsulfatase A-like enzyme
VKPPTQFEGRSVLPVASGRVAAKDWPEDDFIYEYYWEWSFPQTPTTFAIERGRMKYIQYHGVWDLEELYDLDADPDEMVNLINDPAHFAVKAELRRALFAKLANNAGGHVVPYTEKLGEGQVYRNQDGPGAAAFPPEWIKAPPKPKK